MTLTNLKTLVAATVALAAIGIASNSDAASCDHQGNWRTLGGRQAKIVVRAKALSSGWTATDGSPSANRDEARTVTDEFKQMTKVEVGGSESMKFTFAKGGSEVQYEFNVKRKEDEDAGQGSRHFAARASAVSSSAAGTDTARSKQAMAYKDAVKCERQYKRSNDIFQWEFVLP